MTQLTFVGGGKMGEALIAGALRGDFAAGQIDVIEPDAQRAKTLTQLYGVKVSSDAATVAGADVVVLAVKPQVILQVCGELRDFIAPQALVVSIAAGITTASLEGALATGTSVVRVMPNTPAFVGEGMSVLSAGAHASQADLDAVRAIFEPVSRVLVVDESDQNAVTAISGSGPAYFFYLVEAMEAAGVELGLSAAIARELAVQTAVGASAMLSQTGEDPAVLRGNVTSPGGTTAAAISMLEQAQVRQAIGVAIKAAYQRSIELA